MDKGLEAALGHHFARTELLDEALTHRSVGKPAGVRRTRRGGGAPSASYERLEFLGDRVVGLVVAEMLLAAFPREAEGALAQRHAALVRKETLADIAIEIELAAHVHLPAIEERAARSNPSLLADVCEAVIAALYLDGGFEVARQFIARYWTKRMEAVVAPPKDPKTALQEWAQARGKPLPTYRLVKADGPAHQPHFTVAVAVEGLAEVTATGASKRHAEVMAATVLLERIGQGNEP
jgi:ribonuclease-3